MCLPSPIASGWTSQIPRKRSAAVEATSLEGPLTCIRPHFSTDLDRIPRKILGWSGLKPKQVQCFSNRCFQMNPPLLIKQAFYPNNSSRCYEFRGLFLLEPLDFDLKADDAAVSLYSPGRYTLGIQGGRIRLLGVGIDKPCRRTETPAHRASQNWEEQQCGLQHTQTLRRERNQGYSVRRFVGCPYGHIGCRSRKAVQRTRLFWTTLEKAWRCLQG